MKPMFLKEVENAAGSGSHAQAIRQRRAAGLPIAQIMHLLAFKPDLLAVSAGFDAYKEDPIAGLRLDRATFKTIGSLLAQTKLPRFATLEGGYSEDLPKLVESFLDGFF